MMTIKITLPSYFILISLIRLIPKKRPTPEPLFRRYQRFSNDLHTGRLQLLFHQTTSIATLRLDGPAHARLPTDHVVG